MAPEESGGELLETALLPFASPPVIRRLPAFAFDEPAARRELGILLGTLFLDGFGLEHYPLGVAAAGAILRYLRDSQTEIYPHLDRVLPYSRDDFLDLDEATLRHLEIFENWRTGGRQGSLLEVLDLTVTPMGSRQLGRWLRRPLKDLAAMEREHILRVLKETGWRIEGPKGAAAILQLHLSTLRFGIKKLGIRRP